MTQKIGRRAFLQGSSLLLAAGTFGHSVSSAFGTQGALPNASLKVGLVTDLHYADKPKAGSRYYRESLSKLEEATAHFQKERVNFVVELGDFIDAAPEVETELGYLKTINSQFQKIKAERHYVLGNHCVETLTKEEFLGEVGQERSFYSFDRDGFHFVVLDACFNKNGTPYGRRTSDWRVAFIPPEQLEWLHADLKETENRTIVFAHQRLDVDNHYAPVNVADVRRVLEQSGKVSAVFQGHSHKNDYKDLNGIHYCTHVAMIEGTGPAKNAYSVLHLFPNGEIKLEGFREQKDYSWATEQIQ